MSGHTPGPWHHDYDGDSRSRYVYIWADNSNGPAEFLARVDTQVRGMGSQRQGLADVALIVAAPLMLRALKDAENILRFAPPINTHKLGTLHKTTTEDALANVRAAIAKAEAKR